MTENDTIDMTEDEIALALVAANLRLTAREHIIRRLVDLMEAEAPTQDDWDEAIADAKEVLA